MASMMAWAVFPIFFLGKFSRDFWVNFLGENSGLWVNFLGKFFEVGILHPVIDARYGGVEEFTAGFKDGLPLRLVAGKEGRGILNLAQSTAALFHVAQLGEDFGDDGITSFGGNLLRFQADGFKDVRNATRRSGLNAVVVYVNAHLRSQLAVVAMDEVVYALF